MSIKQKVRIKIQQMNIDNFLNQILLDADPKAIQQIEFVGKLKKKIGDNGNATDAGNDQSMFVLTI